MKRMTGILFAALLAGSAAFQALPARADDHLTAEARAAVEGQSRRVDGEVAGAAAVEGRGGEQLLIRDYFSQDKAPDLDLGEGTLGGHVVARLAGPMA